MPLQVHAITHFSLYTLPTQQASLKAIIPTQTGHILVLTLPILGLQPVIPMPLQVHAITHFSLYTLPTQQASLKAITPTQIGHILVLTLPILGLQPVILMPLQVHALLTLHSTHPTGFTQGNYTHTDWPLQVHAITHFSLYTLLTQQTSLKAITAAQTLVLILAILMMYLLVRNE